MSNAFELKKKLENQSLRQINDTAHWRMLNDYAL